MKTTLKTAPEHNIAMIVKVTAVCTKCKKRAELLVDENITNVVEYACPDCGCKTFKIIFRG